MATVYVATDLRLERRVALKVMHGHLSDDSVFQSRFIQEARAAARLANPHVVNVFDQGQDAELAYLVMEYLPGITLRQLLREQRRLTVTQTITIMDAILSGLAAAHHSGIVHRDVKPENVLLAEDGRIKIGDFGLARATTANTASGAQLMGTIAYLAPELVTRGTADARSDIYALGIMLYEMLTGEQPYRGEQPMQIAFQHATESVPRPSVRNPGVPEQLDELVLWSTEKSPEARPDDAGIMLARLREIEKELGITPTVAPSNHTQPTARIETDELTVVLPSAPLTHPASVEETTPRVDNATLLRRRTARRRARGGLLVSVVLLAAAIAAAAGWWFGSGPGSMLTVPDVANLTYEDAAALIETEGLIVGSTEAYSLDVAMGLAVSTDPAAGTRVDKGATVTVVLSQGPEPVDLALNGMPEAEARAWLDDQNMTVVDSFALFSRADDGIVINAEITPRDSDESFVCGDGCSAHQGDTVELYVSLGPIPDVVGLSFSAASEQLTSKGLTVPDPEYEYSNSVGEGDVIEMHDRAGGGNWRPGDEVTLTVSLGLPPVEVPDVTGWTLRDAMAELEAAGLSPTTSFPEGFLWDLLTVTSLNPSPGEVVDQGTKIAVRAVG